MKFRVRVGFAKGFLKNFNATFGRPRGKEIGRTRDAKSTLQDDQLAILIRPGQTFEFGKMAKLRMLFLLGNINDRMKIYNVSFKPLGRAEDPVGARGASIDLTAQQRRIELRAAISRDEFWIFETENVSKQAAFNVSGETDGLPSDSQPGGGPEFREAVQPGLLSREKDRMIDAIGRTQIKELVDAV